MEKPTSTSTVTRTAVRKFKQLPDVPQAPLPASCLSCGSDAGYVTRAVTRTVEFRGEKVKVRYHHSVCRKCGDALLTDAQLDERTRASVEAYQRKHGLLTATELKARREALGLRTQRALCNAVPAIAEATLKRLEAGWRVQDKSTDRLIRTELERLERAALSENTIRLRRQDFEVTTDKVSSQRANGIKLTALVAAGSLAYSGLAATTLETTLNVPFHGDLPSHTQEDLVTCSVLSS